jgi:hypothetical protein
MPLGQLGHLPREDLQRHIVPFLKTYPLHEICLKTGTAQLDHHRDR